MDATTPGTLAASPANRSGRESVTRSWRQRFFASRRFLWVLGVGAVAYVTLALLQSSDLDEGVYLLAAVQIAHGQLPFVNFVGIEPVVPYYLSAGVLLFGPSLVVARLQLVLLVLATSAGIYLIARSQHSEGAGLLASGLFLFSPLSLYYSSVVILESASLAPLVFASVLLLRRRLDRPFVPSVAIGALLAVAVLTRRDTVVLVPVFLLVGAYRSRGGEWLRALAGILAGFAMLILPVLGYFTLRTSLAWMNTQYGLGAAYAAMSLPLGYHIGALAYGILTLSPLALGVTGVVAWQLKGAGAPTSARWALRLSGIPMLLVLAVGLGYQTWGPGESVFTADTAEAAVLLGAWLILRIVIGDASVPGRTRDAVTLPFLIAWAGLVVTFFTFVYPLFYVHYLIEVTAPASLLVGIYFADLLAGRGARVDAPNAPPPPHDRPGRLGRFRTRHPSGYRAAAATAVAVVVVVPAWTGAALVLGPLNDYNNPYANGLPIDNLYQRVYPLSEIQEIANYLDAHSTRNATVFTADSIFAAAANRLVLLNLSTIIDHYLYARPPLGMNQTPLGSDPFGLAPTLSQVFSAWNRTYVPFVIVGTRTLYLEGVAPYLARYLAERYHPVAAFDPGLPIEVVEIEALGPPPNGVIGSTIVPGLAQPWAVVTDSQSGTSYEVSTHSADIEVVNVSGSHYLVELPPNAGNATALQLSPTDATLVVGTFSDWLYCYAVGPSGNLSLEGELPFPGPIARFAYGSDPNRVYAELPFESEIVAINTTVLRVVQSITTYASPMAFAVSSPDHLLAVVSTGDANVQLFNLSTGVHLQDRGLGPRTATEVSIVGDRLIGLDATSSELFWLNLTTGTVDTVDTIPGFASSFAIDSGVLAVGSVRWGTVTLFNATTADPAGAFATGSCPALLGEALADGRIWTTGPCQSELDEWDLAPLVPVSVAPGANTSISVNGIDDPLPQHADMLPGIYEFQATSSGSSSVAVVVVSGPTTLEFTVPDLSGSWATYEAVFLGASIVGAAAAGMAIGWLVVRRTEVFFFAYGA